MTTQSFDYKPNTNEYKLTYLAVVDHPDYAAYKDRVKVGDTIFKTDMSVEEIKKTADPELLAQGFISSPAITQAASKRVKEWSGTADLPVSIVLSALNVREYVNEYGKTVYEDFRDYTVHNVLMNSGFKKRNERVDKKNGEWFDIDVDNAVEGFKTALRGKSAFGDVRKSQAVIELRDEQKNAVSRTKKYFKNGTVKKPKTFLWNAIMRFGKTLTTYQLVKDMYEDKNDFKKVLIITHRPVVSDGWKEDFYKIFGYDSEWNFGSRKKEHGVSWEDLNKDNPFVYFASIQDLRGSFGIDEDDDNKDENSNLTQEELENKAQNEIEELFVKNAEIFATEFNLVVIDEGHEGTRTVLAQKMMEGLKSSYKLHLSGTPYNIIEGFDEKQVFNWTYIDERKAFENWEEENTDSDAMNPYGALPTLEIRTFDISRTVDNPKVKSMIDSDRKIEFHFKKFFEVNKTKTVQGQFHTYHPFVHEDMVSELMNKIFQNDEGKPARERGLFPFGDYNSKKLFAHTFWMMPTIDSTVALQELLYKIDDSFFVVNATGGNDSGDALRDVKEAIKKHDRTITLSVGKLATGTTVPEWTGVFLFNNMVSPMNYMQTIFRVKSSGTLVDGRRKEVGYVFDFAPNRTLEMISKAGISTPRKKKKVDETEGGNENNNEKDSQTIDEDGNVVEPEEMDIDEYDAVNEMLGYLPILSYDGVRFEKQDTTTLMQTLKRVYINEAVDKGFEDSRLFNFDPHAVSKADADLFKNLGQIISKAGYEKAKSVKVVESELSEKAKGTGTPREGKEKTEEEKQRLADLRNAADMRQIMMGVNVRVPMLVMATSSDQVVTLDGFTEIIDDESWNEFMPKGFTKDMWKDIKKYYDRTMFEGACEEIRKRVRAMDKMLPLDRAAAMANLFSTFKNVDKETVLTPFRVVNMQVSETLGGLRWMDNEGKWFVKDDDETYTWNEIQDGEFEITPRFVEPFKNESENETEDEEVIDEELTNLWGSNSSTFYDINSKTSLYLLYAASSLFKKQLDKFEAALGYVPGLDMQNVMWNNIVVEQIFLNVRVPYSKKIAQRVLLGYNSDKEINCRVVDVVALKNSLKDITTVVEQKNGKTKNVKISSDDVYKLIGWVLLGVKDKKNMGVDERLAMIDENVAEALKKADENEDKFTAVLSNPPYQVDTGGKRHQVYADFYMAGRNVSEKLSMIFPLGWQTSTGRASGSVLHPKIREDKNLILVDNYYEEKDSPVFVFPEAGTGGVSIVYADESLSATKTVQYHEYGNLVDNSKDLTNISYWGEKTQILYDKICSWMDANAANGMNTVITAWNPFGVVGPDTTNDLRRAKNGIVDYKIEGYTACIAKKANAQGNYTFYVPGDFKKLKRNNIEKYKLVWPRNAAWSNYRNQFIVEPNVAFSDAFIGAYFDTLEHAKNFGTYFKTLFYRFSISEHAYNQDAVRILNEYVPNLSTIKNPRTGKIGWESDWTDEDLKILFKDVLTDEDWEYIEKTALASDGGRR